MMLIDSAGPGSRWSGSGLHRQGKVACNNPNQSDRVNLTKQLIADPAPKLIKRKHKKSHSLTTFSRGRVKD